MITNLSGMGVSVPNGFATTADAFNQFLDQSGVNQRIYELLDKTDIDDVTELAKPARRSASGLSTLLSSRTGKCRPRCLRAAVSGRCPCLFCCAIFRYRRRYARCVICRSAGNLPQRPGFDAVLVAIKHVFASLFNDRAISYRVHRGYDHRGVALSAALQRMVRSDLASSGVMFSIDTESGFDPGGVYHLRMGPWAKWSCRGR